jgi:hypothetical protein
MKLGFKFLNFAHTNIRTRLRQSQRASSWSQEQQTNQSKEMAQANTQAAVHVPLAVEMASASNTGAQAGTLTNKVPPTKLEFKHPVLELHFFAPGMGMFWYSHGTLGLWQDGQYRVVENWTPSGYPVPICTDGLCNQAALFDWMMQTKDGNGTASPTTSDEEEAHDVSKVDVVKEKRR